MFSPPAVAHFQSRTNGSSSWKRYNMDNYDRRYSFYCSQIQFERFFCTTSQSSLMISFTIL